MMTRRRLLRGVPPLRWGRGKDTSMCAALEAALAAAGDVRADLYDWLMGCSGAAFRFSVDPERWDPAAVAPHGRELLGRAARCAGLSIDQVDPPFDDEMRELVWERIVEGVDGSLAPLARGLVGGPEYGAIAGYDDDGHVLFARTYFDRDEREPSRVDFETFAGAAAPTAIFLDRRARVDDATLARDAFTNGTRLAAEAPPAIHAWLDGLGAPLAAKDVAQRAFGDHYMRVALHDARRAAARFLRAARSHLAPGSSAHALRAAEAYGYAADEAARGGVGQFDGSVVARFADPGLRRGWAHALERALAHEREAAAALADAARG